jgi:hypothetical protein
MKCSDFFSRPSKGEFENLDYSREKVIRFNTNSVYMDPLALPSLTLHCPYAPTHTSTKDSGVVLTKVLMDIYITLMM